LAINLLILVFLLVVCVRRRCCKKKKTTTPGKLINLDSSPFSGGDKKHPKKPSNVHNAPVPSSRQAQPLSEDSSPQDISFKEPARIGTPASQSRKSQAAYQPHRTSAAYTEPEEKFVWSSAKDSKKPPTRKVG
jgi:hypothetical protein